MKLTLNTKQYEYDVKKYVKRSQRGLNRALDSGADKISANQKTILRRSVVEWSGELAGSIEINKKDSTRTISPGTDYANWIERGGVGGFMGYHYIRDSIMRVSTYFNSKIKKAL